jgi:hypothetical protein
MKIQKIYKKQIIEKSDKLKIAVDQLKIEYIGLELS